MRPSLARYITPLPLRLEDHHRLKRLLAGKTLEVDFFKGALQKNKGWAPEERRFWRNGIYDQIREVITARQLKYRANV